jgi:hypothetical protein
VTTPGRIRFTAPEALCFVGLNWIALATAVGVLTSKVDAAETGFRYRLIGFIALVVAGVIGLTGRGGRRIDGVVTRLALVYLAWGLVMAFIGLRTNPEPNFYVFGLVPYLLVVLLFVAPSQYFWERLAASIATQTVAGAMVLWILVRERGGMLAGRQIINSETSIALDMLYAWPLLLLTWSAGGLYRRIAALVGFCAMAAFSVASFTRSYALTCGLVLAFVPWSLGRSSKSRMRASIIGVFAIVVVVFLWARGVSSEQRDLFADAWDHLVARTELVWKDDDYFSEREERLQEVFVLSRAFEPVDWVVGQGIGASWSDSRLYGGTRRYFVHIGYVALVFNGGIVSLSLFLGIFGRALWLGLQARRAAVWVIPCVAVLVERFIRMLHYASPEPTIEYSLFLLCASYLATFRPQRLRAGEGLRMRVIETQAVRPSGA